MRKQRSVIIQCSVSSQEFGKGIDWRAFLPYIADVLCEGAAPTITCSVNDFLVLKVEKYVKKARGISPYDGRYVFDRDITRVRYGIRILRWDECEKYGVRQFLA